MPIGIECAVKYSNLQGANTLTEKGENAESSPIGSEGMRWRWVFEVLQSHQQPRQMREWRPAANGGND
jgi:hypothetical protein